jgi:di/tricarboxylate transporter
MLDHLLILALILGALALFAFEVMRPDFVAIGVTIVLLLTGAVTIDEGFSGFSNPAVITVVCMFILSSGLVRTGVADLLAAGILKTGGGPTVMTLVVMTVVGMMSAFMNNIGAVSVLMPAMFVVAQRTGYPAPRLLMPLAFGSLLGGLVTLIGTPPNLLVSIALERHGARGFRMFDFLPTGLAIMTTGALYMALVGRRLIPVRQEAAGLARQFHLEDYLTEVVVAPDSPLAGKTLGESGLLEEKDLAVLRILRSDGTRHLSLPSSPATVLRAEDRLILEGSVGRLLEQGRSRGLQIHAEREWSDETLSGDDARLAEVAIAPQATILDRSIEQADIRRRYGVLVLGFRRRGRPLRGRFSAVPLEVGDVLLVQGPPQALQEMARNHDFLVVNLLEHERRDTRRAPLAIGIMALAVAAASTGILHISVAGLLGVLLMALTGCIRVQEIYREVEWRVIFLIACMMPLGIAMDDAHAGTASWLARHLVALTGDAGPLAVLGALILFTTAITAVMSNAAAAVLLAPIGISVAAGLGLEPHPFLMGIAIGASSTFLTPIGHQANILVYGVGNYRFLDFPRVGLLLSVLTIIVAMAVIPVVWPFVPLAPEAPIGPAR